MLSPFLIMSAVRDTVIDVLEIALLGAINLGAGHNLERFMNDPSLVDGDYRIDFALFHASGIVFWVACLWAFWSRINFKKEGKK